MTTVQRFAAEWGMTVKQVNRLVSLANRAMTANEHSCNGDPHPSYPNASDKSFNSLRWEAIVGDLTAEIGKLVHAHGFTEVVFTGLRPTLKRGDMFVEIPQN